MATLKMQPHEKKGLCSRWPASYLNAAVLLDLIRGEKEVPYIKDTSSLERLREAESSCYNASFVSRTVGLTEYAWTTNEQDHQTLTAIFFFALGGIGGWPLPLAVSIPFISEELFVYGKDKVKPEVYSTWIASRWARLVQGGLMASLLLSDIRQTYHYPLDIVRYNIFSSSSTGPELYGTEPRYFYLLNPVLKFNLVLPLALLSLPALLVTRFVEYKRLGPRPMADESSPFVLLTMRLAPFYLWLGIMTMQPHKEDRFMFPINPLLCFNAAVALYLVRGWMEVAHIKATSSPYKASRSSIFGTFTLWVILITSFVSISRTPGLVKYCTITPLSTSSSTSNIELPRLLSITNLLIAPTPAAAVDDGKKWVPTSKCEEDERHEVTEDFGRAQTPQR